VSVLAAYLDSVGSPVLNADEIIRFRSDFERAAIVVRYPESVTKLGLKVLFDTTNAVDIVVTNRRVIMLADDLSTKGGWSGDPGAGFVGAAAFNAVHALGSKVRHSQECGFFAVPIASIGRVIAPSVPTLSWSKERSVSIGWDEPRNLGLGAIRLVLKDQKNDRDVERLVVALATDLNVKTSGESIDFTR
jgi:hypothetical protein